MFAVYQTFGLEPKQATECRIIRWMYEMCIPTDLGHLLGLMEFESVARLQQMLQMTQT